MVSSSIPQRSIGDVKVGAIGHGLMLLTWKAGDLPSDEEAFASMKAAADAGATNWNTGSFYGNPPDVKANLLLLNRFFTRHPEYASRIFLSVKGGGRDGMPNGPQTEDVIREDLIKIKAALGDKKIDLYELARQISTVEETVPVLKKLQAEGLFDHIGLSEVSARSVRAAAQITTIAMVEVECSLWSLRETELKEVIKACEELNIAIAGYSPLGRGLLTMTWDSYDEVPESHRRFECFSKENFPANLELTKALRALGKKRNLPPSQLALAYLLKLSPNIIPIPGSSHVDRTLENIQAANVEFTDADFDEINELLKLNPGVGERYAGHVATLSWA